MKLHIKTSLTLLVFLGIIILIGLFPKVMGIIAISIGSLVAGFLAYKYIYDIFKNSNNEKVN
jgi:hypothetical protein